MKASGAALVFPERPKSKGSRRRAESPDEKRVDVVGFRPRVPDQLEWYNEKQKSYSNSELLERLTDLVMELEKELGEDYRVVESLAAMEGLGVGALIGRMLSGKSDGLNEKFEALRKLARK